MVKCFADFDAWVLAFCKELTTKFAMEARFKNTVREITIKYRIGFFASSLYQKALIRTTRKKLLGGKCFFNV